MTPLVVEAEGEDLDSVAASIPRADSMEPGTAIVVFGGRLRGWLGKLMAPRSAAPNVLGSALLARGYVRITGGEEAGRPFVRGEA